MRGPGRHRLDPAYAGLKAQIIARTGHHYYADKDDLLIDRLHRRFRATSRSDCAAYAALLADGAAGGVEWVALEAEITIGETFFFRYAEQFAALRQTILPELIAARERARTLRIWSAGCSTGAEPYSVAILVRELLGDALPDWRIAILGSDISAEALATARAAEYGRWALRTMPVEERVRYFTRLPPRPGAQREGGFALRPEFRELVRFEQRNLLTLVEPGVPEAERFDLILCRNVLIYFDTETVAAVVRGLARRLRQGGWLLLGHAEPNPAFAAFLDPLSLPGTTAYRRREDTASATAAAVTKAAPIPSWQEEGDGTASSGAATLLTPIDLRTRAVAPRAETALVSEPTEGAAPADGVGPDAARKDVVGRVRDLADAGETGAAWRALRAALERDPTDAALRFYEGLLARTLGREAEAERAFRAALYLDRGFVMAHYHLGLLLIAQGRPAEAARALDNTVALGQALPPGSTLPEGGCATAGEVAAGAAAARAGIGDGIWRGRP